ncbi:UDP-N-acetylglucosamine pyrophosphorylase [Cavenderia fasciculata]|uniref:UDP-N-acetylglucosamine diphosphorylase n=1 Tax=Cavenderia fasciculata TaxID=261658 RepID=F4QDP7_CACFS|nr:UDP-N-acetylglucosamine pyrophosphorylase [Cavenderia fasciculata]EGG13844.1 UDP-N-acetylglucosamine pyrophosphorylase [Cavenderia fasciculata]|eukprot:XP_004350552.1 UDP-N-acetylglucosamine pyrophosphorylase [Cavenderia fasciculata]
MSTASQDQVQHPKYQQWEEEGQSQVFRWYNQLSQDEKASFDNDIDQIDVKEISTVYSKILDERVTQKVNLTYKGFKNVQTLDSITPAMRDEWENIGYKMIAEGKVGVLLLAGGQATRLGTTFPKGMYEIGLPSGKSLYQIQVERVLRLQELTMAKFNIKTIPPIRWYIMTSKATHNETISFFEKNKYFGLLKESFFFFSQKMIPCLTPQGKIINESSSKISLAPNGNGGLFKSLEISGALKDMKTNGIEYVSQYCVDNVLIKMVDPLFVGYMKKENADCAAKVVAKIDPEEPVGVMALENGKPRVLEYSEIDTESKLLRDENNKLVFNYAHICINGFSREFLERIAIEHLDSLPYHIAVKKIPEADENGVRQTPSQTNGWKLELFIFDVFPYAKHMVCLEIDRTDEFSPLKNNAGMPIPKDSPETCLRDICALYRRFIERSNGRVDNGKSDLCEVSPLVSYHGEGLKERVNGKTFTLPFELN